MGSMARKEILLFMCVFVCEEHWSLANSLLLREKCGTDVIEHWRHFGKVEWKRRAAAALGYECS